MRPIVRKAFLIGFLFSLSPILLLPLIAGAAQWYVSEYLAEQFNLGLLEWDLCTTVLGLATMFELCAIGISIVVGATLIGGFDCLRDKFSNFDAVARE
jgi:hypothetical protein